VTTQADILADGSPEGLEVALDHAESTTYSTALRQRIADVLGELRIAGPWHIDRDQDWVRRPQGGHAEDYVGLVVARDSLPVARWSTWNPTPEGPLQLKSGHVITAEQGKDAADAALLEAGWVLCPPPKTEGT
jgi:hypothetical protein